MQYKLYVSVCFILINFGTPKSIFILFTEIWFILVMSAVRSKIPQLKLVYIWFELFFSKIEKLISMKFY